MTKEIGPRERLLREQREARYAANQTTSERPRIIKALAKAVEKAAKKRGKPRKAKK